MDILYQRNSNKNPLHNVTNKYSNKIYYCISETLHVYKASVAADCFEVLLGLVKLLPVPMPLCWEPPYASGSARSFFIDTFIIEKMWYSIIIIIITAENQLLGQFQ